MNFQEKYLKYKSKYLQLKKQIGAASTLHNPPKSILENIQRKAVGNINKAKEKLLFFLDKNNVSDIIAYHHLIFIIKVYSNYIDTSIDFMINPFFEICNSFYSKAKEAKEEKEIVILFHKFHSFILFCKADFENMKTEYQFEDRSKLIKNSENKYLSNKLNEFMEIAQELYNDLYGNIEDIRIELLSFIKEDFKEKLSNNDNLEKQYIKHKIKDNAYDFEKYSYKKKELIGFLNDPYKNKPLNKNTPYNPDLLDYIYNKKDIEES
jgi:hypothetical protein